MLAATNAMGAALFGTFFVVANSRGFSRAAFHAGLAVLFGMVTVLWVRIERRSGRADPLRRLGRIALGLVLVVLGTPLVVLIPLFWLESQLPPEAGLGAVAAMAMAATLVAVVLVVLVNVVGGLAAGTWAVAGWLRRGPAQ